VFDTKVVAVRASGPRHRRSSWWPLHSSSAEHVHVQVRDGHLPVDAHVHHQAVAALADALELDDFLGQQDRSSTMPPWLLATSSALVMCSRG
jgi:hypothetical protein